MYNKGEWQDRMRHSVSVPKSERLVHHITWKLDKQGRRAVPGVKVTISYLQSVNANDAYRMKVSEAGAKVKYSGTLWHRGARVGEV